MPPPTLLGIVVSTAFPGFDAASCTDGDVSTLCATQITTPGSNWIAVRVLDGTHVGIVTIYNRRDVAALAAWMGTVELWVRTVV